MPERPDAMYRGWRMAPCIQALRVIRRARLSQDLDYYHARQGKRWQGSHEPVAVLDVGAIGSIRAGSWWASQPAIAASTCASHDLRKPG